MNKDNGHEAVNSETEDRPALAVSTQNMWFAAFAIVLLSGLIYLPSIHGSKIWDDTELLNGKGLGNASSISATFASPFLYHYYRPLTSTLIILDHRLWDHGVWGSSTFGYHFTNLLLHVLTTALLIPTLHLAFRSRPIALMGALLFAVQPAQVSTVAWIGGRTDALCTLCICMFCLMMIAGTRSTNSSRPWLLLASLAAFILAVLAKEQALFLLPLVPLALHTFRKTAKGTPSSTIELFAWTSAFLIAAGCLLAAWMRFGSPLHPHWSLVHQLPLVGPTADYYALLLLTPTPRLIHTMTLHSFQKAGAVGILTGYLMMSLIIALFVRLMRREREAAWCFAGCGLLLLPVSNIYPMTTQTIAAYRAGTAGLFVAAVLGWAFVRLLERGKAAAPKRIKLLMAPVILYAAWMGCLTLEDDCVWKNSLMASRAVERYDPESNFAKLETANAYLEFGHFEPAIIRLDKMAARINAMPSTDASGRGIEWDSRSGLADWAAGLYGRAGLLKLSAGDKTTALAVLLKGQALSPQNEQVNAGLATYALLQGDTSGAEGPIRNLLAVQPGLIGLRLRLGKILMQQQRWSEADIEFTQCLAQLPSDDRTYLFTALARLRAGNRIGAAQVLSDGENRRVLDKDKLAAWLKSLGEPDLLRSGGVLHVE